MRKQLYRVLPALAAAALLAACGGKTGETTAASADSSAASSAAAGTEAAAEVPALAGHERRVRRLFDALRGRELASQRIHGDFHLGQTLLGRDGWHIIDFEGEPLKSLAERRRPDSPLRDVAGMVRSFGYAAATATGLTPAEREDWELTCVNAFVGACVDTGAPTAVRDDTLSAYVADKAVYEVLYEHRNRPDWIHIPLNALERLVALGTSD